MKRLTTLTANRKLLWLCCIASTACVQQSLCSRRASAQGYPIPFIATAAGGGTPCSTGIPVYAVTGTGKNYGDGCLATQATINTPITAAADRFGNVFIADQSDDLIRVVYKGGTALATAIVDSNIQATGLVPKAGNIYTVAGGVTALPATATTYYCNQQGNGAVASDRELNNCPGVQAFIQPRGIAVDNDGNVFISNLGTASQMSIFYVGGAKAAALITLENPTVTSPLPGYTYRIAGKSFTGYTGDNGLATNATVNMPRGLYVDAAEDIYLADTANNVIRRIDGTTGFISTVAGHCVASGSNCTVTATSGDGSLATSSSVNIDTPYGVTLDANGNVFIAEGGTATLPGRVRVVYESGSLPGLSNPAPTTGFIYTYAGGGAGTTAALQAVFQLVYGVSVDSSGYLYVTDYRSGSTGSNKIWRVDPTSGNIFVWAGTGGSALVSGSHCNGGSSGPTSSDTRGDGCPATQAYLNSPQESLTSDGMGNYYVADRGNNVVRSFSFNNVFPATATGNSATQQVAFYFPAATTFTSTAFTLQGVSTAEFGDAGNDTCSGGTTFSSATTCVYNINFRPSQLGSRTGAITVLGPSNAVIASLTLSGQGEAALATIDPGTFSSLGSALQPLSVLSDESGNVYVGDGKSKSVLRSAGGSGPLSAVIQSLGTPAEIAVDSLGNIFVADSTSNAISATLVAASGGGKASFGKGLSGVQGVACDINGNLYVADTGNNRLLYLSPITGVQSTVYLPGTTLSAPTFVALDASGNVYVLDTKGTRLVELLVSGSVQLVNLPSGIQATSVAFDAAGDALVTDQNSGSTLLLSNSFTQTAVVMSGLTSPAGVALAPGGNIYVADTAATSITADNRIQSGDAFPTTNIGLTSLPSMLAITNEGNVSTALSTPPYTSTGSAGAFPVQSSTCAAGLPLAPTANCVASFAFQPTLPGYQSATLAFSFSSGSGVQANFSGTATNLILTSLNLSLSPSSGITYGQPLTLGVVLNASKVAASGPSGTIELLVDGKQAASQVVSGMQYTFPLALTVGIHALSVTYSGDSTYASSNGMTSIAIAKATTMTSATSVQSAAGTVLSASIVPGSTGTQSPSGSINFFVDGMQVASQAISNLGASVTVLITDGMHTFYATYTGDSNYSTSSSASSPLIVSRSPTTIALSILPVSVNGFGALQLTGLLTSSGSGSPSGTITFSNGSTVLGKLNVSGTSAVLTTSSIVYTSYSFTASYSGDGLFQPSTITVTEGPDFAVTTPTGTLAVPQGGVATETVTITPINGYSGTLTATCSNLAVNMLCRFQPVPLSVTSSTSSTLSVQVFAGIDPTLADAIPHGEWPGRNYLFVAFLVPVAFLRRRLSQAARGTLCCSAFLVMAVFLAGCGNKTSAYPTMAYVTPVGSTVVTLTATDSNGISRSATFTVVVNSL